MSDRCPICGEKLLPFYDHSKGKDVYEKHNHSKQDDQRSEDDQEVEYVEKECPRCDGEGEIMTFQDIEKCKRCYGSGTIKVRREEE